ncbi:MAG: sugar transferase [Ruminococcaceae bacterium]|nr:sugar transferase [Oscillospiraceae bacterium]
MTSTTVEQLNKQVNTVTTRNLILDRNKIDDDKKSFLIVKRITDILLSVIGMIVLSPVFIITALVVFFECPKASPIFVQDRIGKDGKRFRFYKFRSMIPGAEDKLEDLLHHNEMDGHAFKIKNDPRITKVGKFLRKTSIDELPQLFNVLKGDMSIVGPRPPLPREVKHYDDYELQRLYVTPGLTCYWQTTPNRNDMTFDEWLKMDLEYIEDRSLKTDFNIILSTFIAIVGMNGV